MRNLLFLTLFIVCSMPLAMDAQAKTAFDKCKQAEHTGDLLGCMKKHYDGVSAHLNKVYEEVLLLQSEGSEDGFRKAQYDWINYRDEECAWEVGQVETESLQRIEELSCMSMLAEQRSALLERFLDTEEQEQDIKNYEAIPRWMNVAAREHSDLFWRYGDHLSADLDCDGQSEEIMIGQNVTLRDVKVADHEVHDLKSVVAVIQNPATGKPKVDTFELQSPVEIKDGDKTKKVHCDPNLSLSVIEHPNKEAPECKQALKIERSACANYSLHWDGDAYIFEEISKP